MRRGHRAPPRPALPRRAVIGVAAGDAIPEIEAFRREHDPLAGLLPAHVTLVFPFASSLSALQVATHVRRVAARWPSIPLRLVRVGVHRAEWVFLEISRGSEAIVELHDRLYRRALAPFLRSDLPYEPHVTIGRARDAGESETMANAARAAFAHPLELVLRSLTLVTLPMSGPPRPEAEIGLG